MNSDLIEKIQKLFKLASSSNVHEASLAVTKARELMDRHNLTMSDIEWQKSDTEIVKAVLSGYEMYGTWNRRKNTFGANLISLIARNNNCRAYAFVGSNGHAVCGVRSDIDMVVGMFRTLYPIIQAECDRQYSREYQKLEKSERYKMRNWKKSFRSGVYWELSDRFEEMKGALRDEYAGSKALARLDTLALVDAFVEENIEFVKTRSSSSFGWNRDGASAGRIFGQSLPIGDGNAKRISG